MKEKQQPKKSEPKAEAEPETKRPGAGVTADMAWAQNRIRNHFDANKSSPYIAPNYQRPESAEKPGAATADKAAAAAAPATSIGEPEPAPPIDDDEFVIMKNPLFARANQVPHYQQTIASVITPWGLGFDPSTVRLTTLSPTVNAVSLKWLSEWGTRPSMREIPPTFSPIEAHVAQKAVTLLKGWSQVEPGDQSILLPLLGGETNDLSMRARMNLRPQMPELPKKSEEDQAKILKGVITNKAAHPYVANEEIGVKPVDVSLAGPKKLPGYSFPGRKADAESWAVTYSDGAKLEIIAPAAPDPAYHRHTVQEAADAARYLPAGNRKLLNTILLAPVENPADKEWAAEYKIENFHSYMTAGAAGIVTVYPSKTLQVPSPQRMRTTMIHESGHTWALRTWGQDEAKGKWVDWKKAMDADKASVSGYAQADIGEDVAETISIFGSVKGTKKYDEYKAIVPHRFTMLEKEMG